MVLVKWSHQSCLIPWQGILGSLDGLNTLNSMFSFCVSCSLKFNLACCRGCATKYLSLPDTILFGMKLTFMLQSDLPKCFFFQMIRNGSIQPLILLTTWFPLLSVWKYSKIYLWLYLHIYSSTYLFGKGISNNKLHEFFFLSDMVHCTI